MATKTDAMLAGTLVGYMVLIRCPEVRGWAYEPADFGVGEEPVHRLLLRRGRAAIFEHRSDAEAAIAHTIAHGIETGATWASPGRRARSFVVVPCYWRM